MEVTKRLKPSMERATGVGPRACGLQRAVSVEQAPKRVMWKADPTVEAGKTVVVGEASETGTQRFHRGIGGGTYA